MSAHLARNDDGVQMNSPASPHLPELPVLTDVVELRAAEPRSRAMELELGEQLDAWLIDQLPLLVREAMAELSPKIEQQLLDALMPRLLASLAQWQGEV